MKRRILFFFASIITSAVFAQIPDSLSIAMQVDSLIKASRDLTAKNEFEKALELNAYVERLALETFGRESASYGSCAFNRGWIYHTSGVFPEAERWYIEAKSIKEIVIGKEHPDYAETLVNLSRLYWTIGKYDKAEPLYLEALTLAERLLGKEHSYFANLLNQGSKLYLKMDNFAKAETFSQEALSIQEKLVGKDNPEYATYLYDLAVLFYTIGKYEKSASIYLETLSIQEKLLGKDDPKYAHTLESLANVYRVSGNYEKAEPLLQESKNINEKVLGKGHLNYSYSLNSLGALYTNKADYEKAEPLFIEAKKIRENVLGKEHPLYAESLNNLSILYRRMGNYIMAESIAIEALTIQEKAQGKEHSLYANRLNNLTILYRRMGFYEKAIQLSLEALSIRTKVLGREHPEFAENLNNLSALFIEVGDYEKAEPLLQEVLSIREKAFGKQHHTYAAGQFNLASVYYYMGNYIKAEQLYIEALEIRDKVFGNEHPFYAESLFSLAELYFHSGNYEKAEQLYRNTIAILEKVLGNEHPDYAKSLQGLAKFYENQGLYSKSIPIISKTLHLMQDRLIKGVTFLSEHELSQYASSQTGNGQVNAFLYARFLPQADILPSLSYDHALFQKGFLMQAAARLQALACSSPEATSINNDLKGYQRRIANQLSKPIAERQGLEELEVKANTLEKELARTVAGYADALQQVKWQEVQTALPNSAIALEFVHFDVNFPHKTDSVMYAVLLLRPGAAQPQFIPLFEERELNHLLAVDKERKVENINDLYALAKRGTGQLDSKKKSLYTLIWEKIEASGLEDITTVYYSPSGVLHRLNLGAIAVDEKTNLSDHYNLVALNSTRQLVVPASITPALQDAVVIGGVNYDRDIEIAAVETSSFQSSRSLASYWTESATRGESWNYLKWTEKEADRIAATLNAQAITATTIKGKAASEVVFKGIGQGKPSPRILHIATHGFFFPDPKLKPTSAFGDREPVFKWSDNPMIRSGLVLAGANTAWRNETPTSPDMEDGILTAYEISQINLSNTELVVLSACETGLGDIQGNEGVYGLQRAFKIAGAKYLIMSLWQVPDRPTMEFMTTFYKNWLEGNLTIPDAFRKTQREMRELYSNPYLWAGFVLVE